jgi:MFS family permease
VTPSKYSEDAAAGPSEAQLVHSGGDPTGTRARPSFSRSASFWLIAALLALFLFAASAPSPQYAVYQAMWRFSPITLTEIYAVYAMGALGALLITGRLSDHLGRRPLVMIALIIQISGMGAFIAARGVPMPFAARVLQGVGTGIASGALSAWLLDLQPPENPRFGSLVAGIAPVAGLAGGALGSGLLVQYAPNPLHLVFWLLTGIYALAFAAMPLLPDVVRRTPGWLPSMRPQVGVPRDARSRFATLAPSLIAIWALAGLYLSLGPALAISLLRTDSRVAGGLVIVALAGAGALASAVVRGAEARLLVTRGSLGLILGVGITLAAVALDSTAGLYAGSFIAGLGFGPAFSGVFRSLAPLAPPDKRNALVAAIYVVIYLSFSVPAVIAGAAVTRFGLTDTTYGFGLVVMALATVTTVAVSRRKTGAQTAG